MLSRICMSVVLLAVHPAWSQMHENTTETNSNTVSQSQMLTPPLVSGDPYSKTDVPATRSNYLRTGWTMSTAYSDNVLGGTGGSPTGDVSYSIWPTLEIDTSTSRQHWMLAYSPGFTIYQHTSALNQGNENVAVESRFRLSSHITASLRDSFQKTSNVLNQPDSLAGANVSTSGQPPVVAVIAPAADQLTNIARADIEDQFSHTGMLGATTTFTNLHYLNPAQTPGLSDSSSSGASAFYNHRLSRTHYVGAAYQYFRILTYPMNAEDDTQTHALILFYTIYPKPSVSLSFSGGPQRFEIVQAPLAYRSWSSVETASIGWQQPHTNIAASYGRSVTAGGGLAGAFLTNIAAGSALWNVTRSWNLGLAAAYATRKNVTPPTFSSSQGGHTLSGSVIMQHPLGEHFNVSFGYTRLHQDYSGVQAIASAPNTNREFVSIAYQITRPLGR